MSPANEKTQPVRSVRSGPGCIRRIMQLLFAAILTIGIFASGYATGSGVEILAPAKSLIETAIASLPDLAEALATRAPQATFTPLPTLDSAEVSRLLTPATSEIAASPVATAVPPSATPLPAATEPAPTWTPAPTDTLVPTDSPTDTPVPTDIPTDTPAPTNTPSDTPIPTADYRCTESRRS